VTKQPGQFGRAVLQRGALPGDRKPTFAPQDEAKAAGPGGKTFLCRLVTEKF